MLPSIPPMLFIIDDMELIIDAIALLSAPCCSSVSVATLLCEDEDRDDETDEADEDMDDEATTGSSDLGVVTGFGLGTTGFGATTGGTTTGGATGKAPPGVHVPGTMPFMKDVHLKGATQSLGV